MAGAGPTRHLIVIGGGSAAFAAALRAHDLGATATIINHGLPLGGTCVNVGCIPSKALLRAAEAHHRAAHHPFAGIASESRVADFGAVVGQTQALVEALRAAKYARIIESLQDISVLEGRGRLVDHRTVEVNGERLRGDAILIATGASPELPPVPGLAAADPLTTETVFSLPDLPPSLLVLGGRAVALECAQLFARLGSRVTVLQRSPRLLPEEGEDLTASLTAYLEAEGIEIVTGAELRAVLRQDGEVVVDALVNGVSRSFRAAQLLAATGRRPNTRDLDLEVAGAAVGEDGRLLVDDTLQTGVPGVYGAGDVLGGPMFVYTAAHEGGVAAENALTGAGRRVDRTMAPWVIFTDPQVAGVGVDERQAATAGMVVETAVLPLTEVPKALAARDTRGFVKLVRETATDRLVGARVLAPEGGELLMELSLAIRHGIPVAALAETLHPYLTLSEAVKLAALSFTKDVRRLSCCAG